MNTFELIKGIIKFGVDVCLLITYLGCFSLVSSVVLSEMYWVDLIMKFLMLAVAIIYLSKLRIK